MDAQTMTQEERRRYLINALKAEHKEYADIVVPVDEQGQRNVLRALMNVRMPEGQSREFFEVQDAYLKARTEEKGITRLDDLTPVSPEEPDLYVWRGDITTIAADAIVNAANDQMMGCFVPLHGCIDNAIHTFAGIQLRYACYRFMLEQGHAEPTGKAKITYGYNLPAKYIIHTVGPIVQGPRPTRQDKELLASCYRSCLGLAARNDVHSIAFCCISTGEFHFPNEEAARIAVDTVRAYKDETKSDIKVVFNVFKPMDDEIYRELLQAHR